MKSYTDIEQSKRLAEILSHESADMWYHGHCSPWESERKYDDEPCPFHSMSPNWDKPCWSLAALLNVISKYSSRLEIILRVDKKYNIFANFDEFIVFRKFVDIDNAVDVCVDMIETLHEEKLL